ncbi:MAG: sulfite exporter TauE/SafE family protein [Candidatus Kaiserbacteria bacterium]|nr:MAG: sulfite exporter TauE/SafE family protein [Candidatus Kaiserbacteria bacterium]
MEIVLLAILTFVAATIGTITGFGTSTLMIPVLVVFLPAVEAIFLVAIIHWFGDLWKVTLFRAGFSWRLLLLFGGVGLAASYLGAFVSLGTGEDLLMRVLGAFLALYALFLIFQSQFKAPAGNVAALFGGALSGFFAGMFGIGGAIRSAFLSAFDLPKAVYIATAGAIGLLVDSTRIVTYAWGGATLPEDLWYGLLVFIPVSFVGAQLAKRIVDRVPQRSFRVVVAVFLFLIGGKLLLWP